MSPKLPEIAPEIAEIDARSIYTQPKIDIAKLGWFKPPYGAAAVKAAKTMMK